MLLDKYCRSGLLKPQKPDLEQVREQIARALKDLETGAMVQDKDPEWAGTIAYQAMLRAGRALLYASGYLPTGQAQHKTVVEVCGFLLGSAGEQITNRFEMMRRRRNVFFYGSESHSTCSEAASALDAARQLIQLISKHLK